jgi:hypothetical protein
VGARPAPGEPRPPLPVDAALAFRVFFGVYHATSMKPSPLVARLVRMRAEIDRGDEALERKLRYLFWLN